MAHLQQRVVEGAQEGGVVKQLGGEEHLTSPEEAGLPGAAPLVPVTWAVLLHDIGKPVVKVVDDEGRIIFWHHDEAGRRMAQDADQVRQQLGVVQVVDRQPGRVGWGGR